MIFVWSLNAPPLLHLLSVGLFLLQFLPYWWPPQEEEANASQTRFSPPPASYATRGPPPEEHPPQTQQHEEYLVNGFSWQIHGIVIGIALIAYGTWQGASLTRIRRALQEEWRNLRQIIRTRAFGIGLVGAGTVIAVLGPTVFSVMLDPSTSFISVLQTTLMIFQFTVGAYSLIRSVTHHRQGRPQQATAHGFRAANPRQRQARTSEIGQLIGKLPVEEFVPPQLLGDCKVSQLRQMLEARRPPRKDDVDEHNHHRTTTTTPALPRPQLSFVEKDDLVQAVRDCRNYNESCCICCENYQIDDVLRVLPKCRHEFHVECLDQWAYTFANRAPSSNSQRGDERWCEPTCPLCKTTFL